MDSAAITEGVADPDTADKPDTDAAPATGQDEKESPKPDDTTTGA